MLDVIDAFCFAAQDGLSLGADHLHGSFTKTVERLAVAGQRGTTCAAPGPSAATPRRQQLSVSVRSILEIYETSAVSRATLVS